MRTIESKEQNRKDKKIPFRFWLKNIALLAIYIVFLIFWIMQPKGELKYVLHWGFWLPLTTYVVFYEGKRYFKVYKNILKGILNVDTLIAIGSHITYVYSVVMTILSMVEEQSALAFWHHAMWEVPAVLFISTNIGHALEDKMKNSAVDSYNQLSEMTQVNVTRLIDKNEEIVNVRDLKIGDLIIIKKGDLIPIDGILESEDGKFDYSNITGESRNINIIRGTHVLSGSFNVGDVITLKVNTLPGDSTINKIIEKIEEASFNKPKLQKIADKILKYFLPVGLTIAIFTTIVWLILGYTVHVSLPWLTIHDPLQNAIMAGVTVLVMACPCALGVATPLVLVVTISHILERGIIINEPDSLENLTKIKYIAFDKTGTITTSELEIVNVIGESKYIAIAKILEKDIHHPIAKAILNYSIVNDDSSMEVKDIKSLPDHKGVQGVWENKVVKITSINGYEDKFELNSNLTHVALFIDEQIVLVFEMENKIKDFAQQTIEKIIKSGITPIMITGDNEGVANYVGNRVGIKHIYSKTTPEQKSEIIKELQKKGEVIFVGDGFNDSVAVKTANVSIAFSSGSDITSNIADIAINNEDFSNIWYLLKIAKVNNKNIIFSITWAMIFNTIAIPLAVLNIVSPWIGAITMSLSSIMVVLNTWLYKKKYSKTK